MKKAIAQHKRHPSNLSVPESDISSSGTFVDKGSCEELSRAGKPDAAPADDGRVAVEIAAEPSQESEGLKPPESAFSTSDMSEQTSGQVK